ncbi:hypothetical protein ABB02_02092 [Clostridiaceae bacterium JG1575]|nr:hypothetical protein ABB02_02092 [Clostridiaceae bacterium JG1575]
MSSHKKGWSASIKTAIIELKEIEFMMNTQFQLLLILSGSVELVINGKRQRMDPEDLVLLNQGDCLRVFPEGKNKILLVALHSFGNSEHQSPQFEFGGPLNKEFGGEAYWSIRKIMIAVHQLFSQPKAPEACVLQGLEMQLQGILFQYFNMKNPSSSLIVGDDLPLGVLRAMTFIQRHYAQEITLERIAEEYMGTKFSLARSFKKSLGITVGQFLREVRLFHSVQMLQNTNKRIMEIALLNGYPNVKSLTAAVKEIYGVTPSELRKQLVLDPLVQRSSQEKNVSSNPSALIAKNLGELPLHNESADRVLSLDPQTIQCNLVKITSFLRLSSIQMNRDSLQKARRQLGVDLVSVSKIWQKVNLRKEGEFLEFDYELLDRAIAEIVSSGMKPYLQFTVEDYEHFLSSQADEGLF